MKSTNSAINATTTPTASEPLPSETPETDAIEANIRKQMKGQRIRFRFGFELALTHARNLERELNRRSSPPVASGETPVSVASRDLHRILGLEAERNALLSKVTALEAALREFGRHGPHCQYWKSTAARPEPCTCGLEALTQQEGAR